jgi:hypothetical protein
MMFCVAATLALAFGNAEAGQERCEAEASVVSQRLSHHGSASRAHFRFSVRHDAPRESYRNGVRVWLEYRYEYEAEDGRVYTGGASPVEGFRSRSGSITHFDTLDYAYHKKPVRIIDVWVSDTTCHYRL